MTLAPAPPGPSIIRRAPAASSSAQSAPEGVRFAVAFTRAAVECLARRRSLATVSDAATVLALGALRGQLRARPGDWRLLGLRCVPLDGDAVEVAARVGRGDGRSSAVALRMRRTNAIGRPDRAGRWRCDVIDFGPGLGQCLRF